MPIDRSSGGQDDPARQDTHRDGGADQPAETNAGENLSAKRPPGSNVEAQSTEDVSSFLSHDRTDRAPDVKDLDPSGRRSADHRPETQEKARHEELDAARNALSGDAPDKSILGTDTYKQLYRDADPESRLRAPAPFDIQTAVELSVWQKGGKTEGLLARTDTGEGLWGDKPFKSGYDGPAKLFEARELGLGDDWANLSHVETHAAATMRARSDETNEAVLYLNRRPCVGIYGCYDNMERMLPEGAKVTAYWPEDFKVFIGKPDEEGQM